jgi:hypothetical protein
MAICKQNWDAISVKLTCRIATQLTRSAPLDLMGNFTTARGFTTVTQQNYKHGDMTAEVYSQPFPRITNFPEHVPKEVLVTWLLRNCRGSSNFITFISGLINDTASTSDYRGSNGTMINAHSIRKDVEGSGRDLF